MRESRQAKILRLGRERLTAEIPTACNINGEIEEPELPFPYPPQISEVRQSES